MNLPRFLLRKLYSRGDGVNFQGSFPITPPSCLLEFERFATSKPLFDTICNKSQTLCDHWALKNWVSLWALFRYISCLFCQRNEQVFKYKREAFKATLLRELEIMSQIMNICLDWTEIQAIREKTEQTSTKIGSKIDWKWSKHRLKKCQKLVKKFAVIVKTIVKIWLKTVKNDQNSWNVKNLQNSVDHQTQKYENSRKIFILTPCGDVLQFQPNKFQREFVMTPAKFEFLPWRCDIFLPKSIYRENLNLNKTWIRNWSKNGKIVVVNGSNLGLYRSKIGAKSLFYKNA